MWLLINNIHEKISRWLSRRKRTRITQSGKNCAINCAIQGVRLIWKQKIWLAICEFLWSLTNQNAWFVSSFCTELTLFCTVFKKKTALLLTNQGSDPLCNIQCMFGYDFVTIPPALYLCASGTWKFVTLSDNADTSLPWPNCASEMHVIPVLYFPLVVKASLQTWKEFLPFFCLFCRMRANTIKP